MTPIYPPRAHSHIHTFGQRANGRARRVEWHHKFHYFVSYLEMMVLCCFPGDIGFARICRCLRLFGFETGDEWMASRHCFTNEKLIFGTQLSVRTSAWDRYNRSPTLTHSMRGFKRDFNKCNKFMNITSVIARLHRKHSNQFCSTRHGNRFLILFMILK